MFFRFRRQPQIDPLQVAMTGVRMGERFVQIYCDDPVLLSGLAAKVGLSGGAAVVVADDAQQVAAKKAAAKVGALVEIRQAPLTAIPFDADAFDMVVIDDTRGRFAALDGATRQAALRECRRMLRMGGRLEVVEGLGGGGLFGGGTVARPSGYDGLAELGTGGFTPARVLAEKAHFRFLEGLKR
jgi:SAM-dependent methyltransferase